eukprot:g10693.t1
MLSGVLLTSVAFLVVSPELRKAVLADTPQEFQDTVESFVSAVSSAMLALFIGVEWLKQDKPVMDMHLEFKPYHLTLLLLLPFALGLCVFRWCCRAKDLPMDDLEEPADPNCPICGHGNDDVDHRDCKPNSGQVWTDLISPEEHKKEVTEYTKAELQAAGLWVQHTTRTAEQIRIEENIRREKLEAKRREEAQRVEERRQAEAKARLLEQETKRRQELEAQVRAQANVEEERRQQEQCDEMLARRLHADEFGGDLPDEYQRRPDSRCLLM